MITAYCKDEIPGWNSYVDFLSAKGKRFFVTECIQKEFTKFPDIPPVLHVFESDDADYRAQKAYPVLMERFKCNLTKFSTDLHWLLETGFCMSICADIPLDPLVSKGKVFAITANADLFRRFIKTQEYTQTFEKVVDERGIA
jgi:hypothetical protein